MRSIVLSTGLLSSLVLAGCGATEPTASPVAVPSAPQEQATQAEAAAPAPSYAPSSRGSYASAPSVAAPGSPAGATNSSFSKAPKLTDSQLDQIRAEDAAVEQAERNN